MSIDEIGAGRVMDTLVAEWVMGYECVCDEEPCDCPIHAKNDYDTLLPYSTDIAAAKRIAEKMGFLILQCNDKINQIWLVENPITVNVISSTVETTPLAICRAALKLTEGKDNAHNQPSD